MHLKHPAPAAQFHDFQPFGLACKARNLTEQLAALKANSFGKVPSLQDVDATAPGYTHGLSKAGAR